MSDYIETMMLSTVRSEYRKNAKAQRRIAKSQKREADAKALKAIADALKEHGDPEQYEACRAAIATLFEEVMNDLKLDSSDIE